MDQTAKSNMTSLVDVHQEMFVDDIPFWLDLTVDHQEILDLGCGSGRVGIPLAEAGRSVWGVDLDLDRLKRVKNKLTGHSAAVQKRIHVWVMDMTLLRVRKLFRAVISPCNTFSLFQLDEKKAIIHRVADHLRDRGFFAVSVPNPYLINAIRDQGLPPEDDQESAPEGTFTHPNTGYPVQVSSQLAIHPAGLKWTWIYDHLYPDGRVQRDRCSQIHVYSPVDEYRALFNEGGFSVHLYGDFKGKSFSKSSPYLIIVGRKRDQQTTSFSR